MAGPNMDGFVTWAMANFQPNRFAAVVPIDGGEQFRIRLSSSRGR